MYQHLPLNHPPKFTQIGIFGLKIYHLATLDLISAGFNLLIWFYTFLPGLHCTLDP
jgi:hypothetical protein